MGRMEPLAVGEKNAARLLDMSLPDFLALVKIGSLPPPIKINGGPERWRVDDLRAILSGDAARPTEEFEL